MKWFKMWVNFDDKCKWTADIDNNELGAWVRLLALGAKSDIKGIIAIKNDLPYTTEQIKMLLKTENDYLIKWEKQGAITTKKGIISINNWQFHQSEYDRQKGYRESYNQKLQLKVTGKVTEREVEVRSKEVEVRNKEKEGKDFKISPPEFDNFLTDLKNEFKKSPHGKNIPADLHFDKWDVDDLRDIYNGQTDKTIPLRVWIYFLKKYADNFEMQPTIKNFKKEFQNILIHGAKK